MALMGAWSDLHDTQPKVGILRTTYLEDLAQFKAATYGTTEAQEIKKLLHVKAVRKTAENHSWYLKEHRHGMVDHVLIPVYNISDAPAFMFFLLILYWTYTIEAQAGGSLVSPNLLSMTLITFCWMTRGNPWHLYDD